MGFVYYAILRRAIDLHLVTAESLEEANPPAWKFYSERYILSSLFRLARFLSFFADQ